MAGNSFGQIFRITTFGESHGPAIGVVIDGCPPGILIDEQFIRNELHRRAPGQSAISTSRTEKEEFQMLSGVFEGRSTGAPLCIMIPNTDQRPSDYNNIKDIYRPSHADYTWDQKFGFRDHRGGGRSSARETAARVAAGAIAKLLLKASGVELFAYVSAIGNLQLHKSYKEIDVSQIEKNAVRCPDPEVATKMIEQIARAKEEGDSLGGIITGVITNCPSGLGEPVFDKLHADLGKAMLSINAVKGFEYGSGFSGSRMRGSEHNDPFVVQNGQTTTGTNHSGGIQGGISNGEDIYFNVAFKPVATIYKVQGSIDTEGRPVTYQAEGRHDPCVLPRAVPIVEAMAALTVADHLLRQKVNR